jgi:hypothetical protein
VAGFKYNDNETRKKMSETEGSIEERLTQMYGLAAEVMGLDPEYVASPKTVAAIRVYLKLYSLHSGDMPHIREWLDKPNHELGGTPREYVETEDGLNKILKLLN